MLIKEEVRITGKVQKSIYTNYSKAGHGWILLPTIFLLAVLMQGAQSVGAYWLVWWTSDHWNQSIGFYQGLYAVLGLLQAGFTLLLGLALSYFSFFASRNLHKGAVQTVFYAPSSFFDTTPLGRIMGVFGTSYDALLLAVM